MIATINFLKFDWTNIVELHDSEEGNKVDELSSSDEEDKSAVMPPPLSVPPSLIATRITPVKSSNKHGWW